MKNNTIVNSIASYYGRKPSFWSKVYDNRTPGEKMRDELAVSAPCALAEVAVQKIGSKAIDVAFDLPGAAARGAWVIGNVLTMGYLARGVGRARTFLAECERQAKGKSVVEVTILNASVEDLNAALEARAVAEEKAGTTPSPEALARMDRDIEAMKTGTHGK